MKKQARILDLNNYNKVLLKSTKVKKSFIYLFIQFLLINVGTILFIYYKLPPINPLLTFPLFSFGLHMIQGSQKINLSNVYSLIFSLFLGIYCGRTFNDYISYFTKYTHIIIIIYCINIILFSIIFYWSLKPNIVSSLLIGDFSLITLIPSIINNFMQSSTISLIFIILIALTMILLTLWQFNQIIYSNEKNYAMPSITIMICFLCTFHTFLIIFISYMNI